MLKLIHFHKNKLKVIFFNIFRLPEFSTLHCQSPRTQLLVYNYLHRHFHRDHYCHSKNRGRSHLSLILRQCNRLFEHRFFWQPHLTNWTIALVIIGIHLSTLFFTPQSIWLWQTRTTHVHFIIVPDYHLIVGTANALCAVGSLSDSAWFFLNMCHLSSLTCEISAPGW